MAKIRRDRFAEAEPKAARGISSFYGVRGQTGEHVGPPKVSFGGPINDLYGPHTIFGDPSRDVQDGSEKM